MKEIYDDAQFHDVSFEEFEEMISGASEIEIPLDSFGDFVSEVNCMDYEPDINYYLTCAEEAIARAKYQDAYEIVIKCHKAVPQQQQERLYRIYDVCSEHGILDASIFLADSYFERYESTDDYRGKAFRYLSRIYKAGYLPYYWKIGYCYLNGIGVPPNRQKAIGIFMDGLLFNGNGMCAGYLRGLIPEEDDSYEEATRLFFDKTNDYNYKRAYDLYINSAIHGYCGRGYCLMRIADIQMEHNVDSSITPRKCFLMYKTALKLGTWCSPEADSGYDEDELYYKLGEMYFNGYGTKKDYFRAGELLSYGGSVVGDDKEKQAKLDKYINEAYEKAEQLCNDEAEWKYYRECFERGESIDLFDDWDDPEDAFLY